MPHRNIVLLLVVALSAVPAVFAADDGWIDLFNGRDLEGWKASEKPGTFRVEDGVLIVHGPRSHLYYMGEVGNHDFVNFEWRCSVLTKPGANSGMYFHTEWQEEGWPVKGYEIQVNNSQQDRKRTGGIYAVQDVMDDPPASDDVWFTQHVIVTGKRIVVKVDGEVTADYTESPGDERRPDMQGRWLSSGTFAIQGHDPGSEVHYRDCQVKILPVSGAAAATQTQAEDLSFVDPELRPMARQMQAVTASLANLSAEALPAFRSNSAAAPPLGDVPWEERQIAGRNGAPDVTIYVVNAKPGTSRPGILFMHGGGYVLGSARSDLPATQELAKELDCAIVNVEYRLAPETPWSGSLEDNYAGLKWLHDHADELGVDRTRIAVMGASAGGGHAALLALTARDRGEVPLAFQLLVYPMLDDRTGSTRQQPSNIGAVLWSPGANRFGWRAFLGQEPGGANAPVGAVPARFADLSGLPPTWIGVGDIDLFVDEDIEYARRLVQAGVPTELLVVPGAFHAFDAMGAQTTVGKRFNKAKLNALRRAFGIAVLP